MWKEGCSMKRKSLLKGMLIALLLIVPLLLSGCVVGGGVENTSTSDLTFPDINTVINPPTTAPTASIDVAPLNPATPTPVAGANWGPATSTPSSWIISSAPPTSGVSSRVTPPPTSGPTATPTGTLKLGSQGEAVKEVQTRLKSLGFYRGSVDGDFAKALKLPSKRSSSSTA